MTCGAASLLNHTEKVVKLLGEAATITDPEKAIICYQKAERVFLDVRGKEDCHLADVYEGLGNSLLAKGDPAGAVKYLNKFVKLPYVQDDAGRIDRVKGLIKSCK